MIDQPIYSRKAYIIVGINKNNPTDIIGYCENSFSMGWTRHWVNIWTLEYNSKKMAEAEVTQLYVSHFCELYNKGEKYYKNCIAPYDKEKYGKFLEKAFSGKVAFEQVKQEVFKHFFNTTTYSAQGVWNHIKQHLSTIPDGYEIKIFRLNSKNCQIICDLRHRYALEHYNTKEEYNSLYSKWDYRNPMFVVKAKVGPSFKWPDDLMHSVKTKKFFIDTKEIQRIAINKNYSRSANKILKKQRKNSFAAKERKH